MLNSVLLKGRWLYFILSLTSILVIMFTSGCGETHQTYNYGNFTKQLSATAMHPGDEFYTFHPGDQFTLKWAPTQGAATTASSPDTVKIIAELKGPFATLDAMHQALAAGEGNVNGPVVASMKPIQTDTWTNKTYQYDFPLDAHLAPAYYVLLQEVDNGNNLSISRSEIQVAA